MATATRTRTKKSTARRTKPKESTDELDGMKATTGNRGGCPRCRQRDTKGFLKLDVIKYGPEKSAKGAKHIKSKSRSMCGTCIKEVFGILNATFDKEVNG